MKRPSELFAWNGEKGRWVSVGVFATKAEARAARKHVHSGNKSLAIIQDQGLIPPLAAPGDPPGVYRNVFASAFLR